MLAGIAGKISHREMGWLADICTPAEWLPGMKGHPQKRVGTQHRSEAKPEMAGATDGWRTNVKAQKTILNYERINYKN